MITCVYSRTLTYDLTFELDLQSVKMNQHATYVDQRSFHSNVIVLAHTHTHTQTGPINLLAPQYCDIIVLVEGNGRTYPDGRHSTPMSERRDVARGVLTAKPITPPTRDELSCHRRSTLSRDRHPTSASGREWKSVARQNGSL